MYVTVGQLANAVHGRLEMGNLPPLDGSLTVVGRVRTDVQRVLEGDVYWAVDGMSNSGRGLVEEAFARGAAGIVAAGYCGAPWSGRWAIHVDDAGEAFLSTACQAIAIGLRLSGERRPNDHVTRQPRPSVCEKIRIGQLTLLDWSRDATPDLWPDALEELRGLETLGRRWIVCGDLCGPRWDTGAMHRQLGIDAVRLAHADGLVACGQFARDVALGTRDAGLPLSRVVVCRHVHEAIGALRQFTAPDDAVLVAGSRHLNMFPVIEYLQRSPSKVA